MSPSDTYGSSRWHAHTRRAVLLRDLYTCQRCGSRDATGQTLLVGHQDGVENVVRWGADPFDPAECWTVCVDCALPGDSVDRSVEAA
jgi:5-methylcytosine-specific restriction endonuclease McrA